MKQNKRLKPLPTWYTIAVPLVSITFLISWMIHAYVNRTPDRLSELLLQGTFLIIVLDGLIKIYVYTRKLLYYKKQKTQNNVAISRFYKTSLITNAIHLPISSFILFLLVSKIPAGSNLIFGFFIVVIILGIIYAISIPFLSKIQNKAENEFLNH